MNLPNEIWHQILLYANTNTIINLTKIKKNIFNHCNKSQFWIDKFKHDDFTIFNNPSTINEYVKQYKLIVEAKRIAKLIVQIANIERNFDKNDGTIVVRWDEFFSDRPDFNDKIVPIKLQEAIKNKLLETGRKHCPNYIIINLKDEDSYNLTYCMWDKNIDCIEETDIIMSSYNVLKFLINVQYVILADLVNISICDNDECFYYDNETYAKSQYMNPGSYRYMNQDSYGYIEKYFTRIGIRKVIEDQKISST